MKIYTKTGDAGETALLGGVRVRKSDARIDAYGTLDELNATLGVARAELNRAHWAAERSEGSLAWRLDAVMAEAQNRLFDLGAELARPAPPNEAAALGDEHADRLESEIDTLEEHLEPLRQFILPGGTALAAQLHLARCVCRRAERRVVALAEEAEVRDFPGVYLNRLSDLLFVMARAANHAAATPDTPWAKAT